MTDASHSQAPDFPSDALPPENDLTVDLTQEEFGEEADLQALADEIADYEPDAAPAAAPAPAPAPDSRAASGMNRDDLEAELARVRARLELLEKAENEHKDKHHRLMADFANHRNRVGRETQLAITLAERKLLLEMLPVLDSFERCIGATYTSLEDFHAGVVLIHRQMQEALRKSGVEALALAVGDPFDAQHAEALTTTSQPNLPDGSVAAIYERGYLLRDQLLRPARVIVNNHPEGDPPQDPS